MLSKIMTALRGKANESGQAVVDSQALRILDQEIRDSENHQCPPKEAVCWLELSTRHFTSVHLKNLLFCEK